RLAGPGRAGPLAPGRRPGPGRSPAVHRQAERAARALPQPALDLETPAVQRQQTLDDRQAQAGAVVATVVARSRLEERIPEVRQILRADADPVVLHGDHDSSALRPRADRDPTAPIGELDRVGKEVEHDLTER